LKTENEISPLDQFGTTVKPGKLEILDIAEKIRGEASIIASWRMSDRRAE
jgi:hypothetical protein